MYSPTIFKQALTTIGLVLLLASAKAQSRDTLFYFFRNYGPSSISVPSLDKADFIRIIPPFRLQDDYIEIKEVYNGGGTKFAGKAITSTINIATGFADYEGPCIEFYPTGKRQKITTYKDGLKDGLQYFYYPDGKPYIVLNHIPKPRLRIYDSKLVDFYDKKGVQICSGGNGEAITYDVDFNEHERGPVKNGKKDGEWRGLINDGTVGKYSYFYKENVFKSGMGYEASTGKSYPFTSTYVPADPPLSQVYFIIKFKDHIKLPSGTSVTKSMIDSTKIYFTVEDDGRLTNFDTIEPVTDELLQALKAAFEKCSKWKPGKLYGIPIQTQVVLSLTIQKDVRYLSNDKDVENYQMVLHKGVPITSLPIFRTYGY